MDGESPVMASTGGFVSPKATSPSDSRYWRWPSLYRMSNPRVDLPEPDTPVRTMSWFLGIVRVIFFRTGCARQEAVSPNPHSGARYWDGCQRLRPDRTYADISC